MADSAPKIAGKERREAPEIIDQNADALVDLIKGSKHFIAFTGAGVSTSAGIPDFRGPDGSWTLRAQGRQRSSKTTSTLQAIPTPTHMALVELQNRGILKYLVSQNCDGLHRRSGILPDKISELHGNSNKECCKDCGKEYIRDFRAVAPYTKSVHDHRTSRKCDLCYGPLLDTIVNFGEYLPTEVLENARSHAKKADLCLVLGSSLTIPPANEIPETVGKKRKSVLVICNLQETPLDELSNVRIWGEADDFMVRVMEKLEIPIPSFVLKRTLVVKVETKDDTRHSLTVRGVDVDGTPASFLRSVKLGQYRRTVRAEPFAMNFRDTLETGKQLKLELEFMGNYGEPNLEVSCEWMQRGIYGREKEYIWIETYDLEYDPQTGTWKVEKRVLPEVEFIPSCVAQLDLDPDDCDL